MVDRETASRLFWVDFSFHNCLNYDGRQQQQDGHNCGCYVISNARKAVGFRTGNGYHRKDLAIDVLRGFI